MNLQDSLFEDNVCFGGTNDIVGDFTTQTWFLPFLCR